MKNNKFFSGIKSAARNVKFGVKKHSPEILIVSGIVGLVGAGVLACRATTKVQDILNERDTQLGSVDILENDEHEADYTTEDAKRDRIIISVKSGLKIARLYAPAVLLGVTSAISILAGHNILSRRNAALAAAYATVEGSFNEYRKRVAERFGEEVDNELKFGVKAKQITETITDENDKEKHVKKTVNAADSHLGNSPYAFIFDKQTSPSVYEDDIDYTLMRLRCEQQYANDILVTRGYLSLNEVLERLGLKPSKMGQIVGWAYDYDNPSGDNFVDFGAKELDIDTIDGAEKKIVLDFNCQGNILDLI